MKRGQRPVLLTSLVLLAACTPPPPSVDSPERLVTAEPAEPWLAVPVPGVVTNRQPVPTVPPAPWLPLARLTADGATVAPGEDLLAFDVEDVRRRRDDAALALEGTRAGDTRRTLESERQRQSQITELANLRSRAEVLVSRQAGRRRDEPAHRRIASLQVEVAQRTRTRAQERVAAVAALVETGRLPAKDLIMARADLTQAEGRLAEAHRAEASWDNGSEALTQASLDLDLAEARDRLEGGSRSLVARQELAVRRDRLQRAADALGRQGQESEVRLYDELTAKPTLTAAQAGRVVYRDPGLRPGAKRARTPLLFVLEDHEDVVELLVPADLRDLVAVADPAEPNRGRVRLRSSALPDHTLEGRIIAIAAAPVTREGDRTGFPVTVRFHEDGPRPPVGATVEAELLVPIQNGVRLPRWAVHSHEDPREPLALLEDGSTRRLRAVAQDAHVIVLDGLTAGQRVQALGAPPSAARAPRLAGTLEAEGAVVVRLRSGDWDVVEVVPDGARVEAGAVLARLAKNSSRRDYERLRREQTTAVQRAHLASDLAHLDADLTVLEARSNLAGAQFALRRALLDRRRVDLDGLAERITAAEATLARQTSTAAVATISAQAAEDPRVRLGLSTVAAADLRLAGVRAQTGLFKARLDLASARVPDQFRSANATLAVSRAEAAVASAARSLTLVRMEAAAAHDRATASLLREEERIAREGELMIDETVIAPINGRVVYGAGAPLTPGAALPSTDLLAILPDPDPGSVVHRRLALQVPAHRATAWHPGDEVPVTVPGAGTWPAKVKTVGTWYGSRIEDGSGDEQVTDLVLSLDVPAEAAERVLPGMKAWIP